MLWWAIYFRGWWAFEWAVNGNIHWQIIWVAICWHQSVTHGHHNQSKCLVLEINQERIVSRGCPWNATICRSVERENLGRMVGRLITARVCCNNPSDSVWLCRWLERKRSREAFWAANSTRMYQSSCRTGSLFMERTLARTQNMEICFEKKERSTDWRGRKTSERNVHTPNDE